VIGVDLFPTVFREFPPSTTGLAVNVIHDVCDWTVDLSFRSRAGLDGWLQKKKKNTVAVLVRPTHNSCETFDERIPTVLPRFVTV